MRMRLNRRQDMAGNRRFYDGFDRHRQAAVFYRKFRQSIVRDELRQLAEHFYFNLFRHTVLLRHCSTMTGGEVKGKGGQESPPAMPNNVTP